MRSRRTLWLVLLGVITVAVVGMVTTSVLGDARQPNGKLAVALAGLPDMASVPLRPGVLALGARFSQRPTAILLARDGQTWHAFSNRSTHQGEPVLPYPAEGVFMDPYHGTVFDRTGRSIAGPAPRALDSYPVTVEGGYLIIDLSHPQLGR